MTKIYKHVIRIVNNWKYSLPPTYTNFFSTLSTHTVKQMMGVGDTKGVLKNATTGQSVVTDAI